MKIFTRKEVAVELAAVKAKIALKRDELSSPFWHTAVPLTSFALYKIFDPDMMLVSIFFPVPIIASVAVSMYLADNKAELRNLLVRQAELEAEVNFKNEKD